MLFPGDTVVFSLTLILSVPLFIVQFLLCRSKHRFQLLPLALPGLVFLASLLVDAFVGSDGSYYRSDIFITAVLTLVGQWFLVIQGLAWLAARLTSKRKK